jgi:dTDP-glucose 4,6-dehydratase
VAESDLDEVLVGLWPVLDDLRGRRLLVTGGTGFFGRWLLESLRHANRAAGLGASAVVLSRDPRAFDAAAPHLARDPAIELVAGDVRTFRLPEGPLDFVLHGAATSDARAYADAPVAMIDTIVEGTRRAIDAALERGAKRMLFVSSGAVYGAQPPDLERVPETFTGAPELLDRGAVYGHAKRMAEHLCAHVAAQGALEIPIARCFAFVGPHLPLDAHFAIGNFLRDALAGGAVRVSGDGTPFRSYLYASDLACWLLTLLARGRSARAYNVGSGEGLTIGDLARRVARRVGAPVVLAGAPVLGAPAARYVPDVSRVEVELGLRVRVALEDALDRTLAYHRG